MKYKIGLSILVLVFASCMKIKKKDETSHVEQQVQQESVPHQNTEKIETLSGEIVMNQNKDVTADVVILKSDLKIFTRNNVLKIEAKKIISEYGAVITNFKSTDSADIERKGLDGGMTYLLSEDAEGTVFFIFNGQQGGYGRNGFDRVVPNNIGTLTRFCYGNSGADSGRSGSAYLKVGSLANFQVYKETQLTPGGRKGGHVGRPGHEDQVAKTSLDDNCNTPNPQDGKPGYPGIVCVIGDIDTAKDCMSWL